MGAFRTLAPDFEWTDADFVKPAQDRLVIYELLVRDWDAAKDFDAVVDRLDHLEWLGITAIELMPVRNSTETPAGDTTLARASPSTRLTEPRPH